MDPHSSQPGIYYLCKSNYALEYYGIHTAAQNGSYVATKAIQRDLKTLGRAAENHRDLHGWLIAAYAPERQTLLERKLDDPDTGALLDRLAEHYDDLHPLTWEELKIAGLVDKYTLQQRVY